MITPSTTDWLGRSGAAHTKPTPAAPTSDAIYASRSSSSSPVVLALRSNADDADEQDCQTANSALQARVVEHYIQPLEAILQSPEAHDQLDEFDLERAVCQLMGPLLFAWMIGLRVIDHQDCARIVDDFLAGHRRARTATASRDA